MVLECANGALHSIAVVHVRRDKLKLGVPLEGDGFLISGAGFIVQDLEVDSEATGHQPCHDGIVGLMQWWSFLVLKACWRMRLPSAW